MTNEELPVSNEFITSVKIQLDQEQRQQLLRYLNLHYLGDVNCNEYDENDETWIEYFATSQHIIEFAQKIFEMGYNEGSYDMSYYD